MQHRAASQQIFQKLSTARKPILVAHRKPDGDTLGAMMAVFNWLRDQGRAAHAFCVDEPASVYAYFPRIRAVQTDPQVFQDEEVDMICVFDAGDLKYAGIDAFVEAMPKRPYIADFDHHITNTLFGDGNLVITNASSTAEVVHEFFDDNNVEISRSMATCLMTGLLTDTSNFSNPATTVKSLEIASELLLKGVSIRDITKRLMRNKPFDALKLWGRALERLRWDPEKKLASTALFREDFQDHPIEDEYMEGLSNFLNHLLQADVVLVLKETEKNKVKGSYRSATDTDVAEMAKAYGGGGHRKAAGFLVDGAIVERPDGWIVQQSDLGRQFELPAI
ncbi:MAG: DHH family phosphoesterase [Patescibacteria group bacterium]|nr:MAG: DHH family phosphoesterase [Patescibacteria group bacterium]